MLVRALKHIQTATQTNALHIIPRVSVGINASDVFPFAMFSAANPTVPPPNVYCVVKNISAAVAIAPTKLSADDKTQLKDRACRDLVARPGHDKEVVPCEELRPSNED
jgi:hypothetical protein